MKDVKQGVLNQFYQIIDVQLHKNKSMNQLYIHDLDNFCFKGPNQLYVI
jgi:regulator of sigma D